MVGLATGSERGGRDAWTAEVDGYSALPFVLRAPLRWREVDGALFLELGGDGRREPIKPAWVPAFEAFNEGGGLPEAHARTAGALPDRRERAVRYLVKSAATKLLRLGLADVELPPVPDVFDARYDVLEELGRGGMGVVWRCADREADGREVAVKHAWNFQGAFERREAYLEREADVMASLDDPHVVRFIATFHHEGRLHLVRELVPGRPLEAAAADRGLDRDERLAILAEIVDGLARLAGRGLLCLDVKTPNYILEAPNGRPRFMDLGLVRELDDGRVRVRGTVGNRAYAAPELGGERYATERTVVFNLGRVLAHLVTGQAPRPHATLDGYARDHGAVVGEVRRLGSDEEARLVDRWCALDPLERPAELRTALAMVEEVARGRA